ncbi:MAG: geranylgeranyl reductase [Melioribacteraceae bacterium]|nr:MAG: geranylgeranyl reductase [Melioribacteraceae bacterium]
MSSSYDVVIIGAGPAGSSAGYHLAKAGVKTLILDKAEFPRYKSCGGGIITRSDKFIPYDYSSVVEQECNTALLADLTVKKEFFVKRDKPVVRMVMRDNFDEFAIQKAIEAGCHFNDNITVRDINYKSDPCVELNNEKIFCDKIIGADGAFGITTRVSGHFKHLTAIPAMEIELNVDHATFRRFNNIVRFDFGLVENGYGWVFPKKEHLSIGVLSFSTGKYNLNQLLQKYLHAININTKDYQRHGFKIPILPTTKNFAYSNLLLTGDAAGFADPITLEGIGTSILSGKLAADAIIKSSGDSSKTGARYNRLLKKELLHELKYACFLSNVIYNHPAIRKFLFKNMGALLCEKMTDVITGDKTYFEYLSKPSNYIRLVTKLISK